jgi:hypothetical protein
MDVAALSSIWATEHGAENEVRQLSVELFLISSLPPTADAP